MFNSSKYHFIKVTFVGLVFLLFPFNLFGKDKIEGEINLPEGWSPKLYLSVIYDYREMTAMDRNQVIATIPVDSLGRFQVEANFFKEQELIYRLHVATTPAEDEYYLADFEEGGFGYNFRVFQASLGDVIRLLPARNNSIFGPIQSTNKEVDNWFVLDSMYLDYISVAYNADEHTKDHLQTQFQQNAINQVEAAGTISRLLAIYYLIEEDVDLSPKYLENFSKNHDFYSNVLKDLEEDYPFYHERLEKEIAMIDLQIDGNKLKYYQMAFWISLIVGVLLLLSTITLGLKWVKLKKATATKSSSDSLTKQEQKIKELILKGNTNKEIANELHISLSTVKTHINAIYKKEGVQSRESLIQQNSNRV